MIIIIFADNDFPNDEELFSLSGVKDRRLPWPPRLSTHPPSRLFCIICPINIGNRAITWLLIGVANAIDVKK